MPDGPLLLVWGNCQAEGLRRRLDEAATEAGLTSFRVPPVHEITVEQRDAVHALAGRVEVLVTQPVSDEYRVTGLGSDHLAGLVTGRTITVPVLFSDAFFPWQVYAPGHVDAPLTIYHDVRVAALAAGLLPPPGPAGWRAAADEVRAHAAVAWAETARRAAPLAVQVVPLGPDDLVTINHPAGHLLDEVAARTAAAAGLGPAGTGPTVGALRTPLEAGVLDALGHAGHRPSGWELDGRPLASERVLAEHLAFYAARPDVRDGVLAKHGDRLAMVVS